MNINISFFKLRDYKNTLKPQKNKMFVKHILIQFHFINKEWCPFSTPINEEILRNTLIDTCKVYKCLAPAFFPFFFCFEWGGGRLSHFFMLSLCHWTSMGKHFHVGISVLMTASNYILMLVHVDTRFRYVCWTTM